MTPKIGRTKLGVYFIYGESPFEPMSRTRELVPALRGVSLYDTVSEREGELEERFAHLKPEKGVDRYRA